MNIPLWEMPVCMDDWVQSFIKYIIWWFCMYMLEHCQTHSRCFFGLIKNPYPYPYPYPHTNPSNKFLWDSKTSQVFPSYLFATTAATSFTWLKNNQCKRYGIFYTNPFCQSFNLMVLKFSTTESCLKLRRNLILLTKCSFCCWPAGW